MTTKMTGALSERPAALSEWENILEASTRVVGRADAPVRVVVLADLACPACARFHELGKSAAARRPETVQVLHAHYPLEYHEGAYAAAIGAECALALEGPEAFGRWLDAAYSAQDALQEQRWADYAGRAGLADAGAIVACIQREEGRERVLAGVEWGQRLPVEFTPTVVVEGWRFFRSPTAEELDAAVDAIVAGRRPEQRRGRAER